MSKLIIQLQKLGNFNSIRLQTELLAKSLAKSFGYTPIFISEKELKNHQNKSDEVILLPYGSFRFDLIFKYRLNNVVIIYHNITPPKFFWKSEPLVALRAAIGLLQLRRLSHCEIKAIAVSEFNKKELLRLGFKDVQVCPNIILPSRSCTEEKFLVPTLLYVGRIVQNKDCISLLKCVRNVALKSNNKIQFNIVGKGKEGSSYLKEFNNLLKESLDIQNLEVNVSSEINESKLIELYQKSWLYITMSKHEGFGLPVCESISFGTPALYTACGGQEIVLNNVGLVDEHKMDSAISDYLFNSSLREELYKSQCDIIKQYQSPLVDKTIEIIYKSLI